MTWRTEWEPLPDITAYELALDMKHVSANVVSERSIINMGVAGLRHRTTILDNRTVRMDKVAKTWLKHLSFDFSCSNQFSNITQKTNNEFDDERFHREYEMREVVRVALDAEMIKRSI